MGKKIVTLERQAQITLKSANKSLETHEADLKSMIHDKENMIMDKEETAKANSAISRKRNSVAVARHKVLLADRGALEGYLAFDAVDKADKQTAKANSFVEELSTKLPVKLDGKAYKKALRAKVNTQSLIRTIEGLVCVVNEGKTEETQVFDLLANVIGMDDEKSVFDWCDMPIEDFDFETDELDEVA